MTADDQPQSVSASTSWLSGGGKMGQRIREYNWSGHPLGVSEHWPQSLKTALRIMLASRSAMWLGWGADFILFYNDAYVPTLGNKESSALGASTRTVWKEIWPEVGPRAESVMNTGVATWDEGLLLLLERGGFTEETYHTFSYSPIPDDDGHIGGMLCIVTEETERLIGQRRLTLLQELSASLPGITAEADLFATVKNCFETHRKDIPLALLYLLEPRTHQARLACASGVEPGSNVAPEKIDFDAGHPLWPLKRIVNETGALIIEGVDQAYGALPPGVWGVAPRRAMIVRIFQQGIDQPVGFLVAGLNPYCALDSRYEGFIDLLAGQIAAALGVLEDTAIRERNEEARRQLAAIVEFSDDAIISKGLDSRITSWNLGAERLFGYAAAEAIGRPITLLIPPERRDEEISIIERIRRGERTEHFETVRIRKDGRPVDVSVTISPLRDRDGSIVGASKIAREITDQKRTEAELRQREKLYRSIGESIDYGIWVCDAEGKNLYASDSFLNLVGMTQEECSSFGWGKVLHPDEIESTIKAWQECSKKGDFWEREHRFKGKDGEWHPVLARGVPIRDDKGQIERWVGINLDISGFRKTESALREQTQILEVLNSVSGTLVAERDLEKIVQSVTDASRQISGAAFGAFFYNVTNEKGESFTLYTLSGVPKEAFAKFPMPRSTALFGPTFHGEGVVRIGDVLKDPRYGKSAPYHGMPEGHLPVRSYLAVPVISNSGKVIGGMFLGHPETDVFTAASEAILVALAAQAAIAIDNADLYTSLQRELTEVRRVQDELRASEGRWRHLAEAMPHLVWTCMADGTWDFVSPQWCAYTGHTEAEQRGFGWAASIHPEDRPGLEAAWNKAAHARSILDVEVRIRRSDGVYRWFKARAVPVTDSGGNILKWYGSNTDIEDIKRTDVVLRENESRLSALFAQAGSGIIQTDLDGRIVMVNDAYCEIVARTRGDLLGKKIHDITHPEDRQLHQKPFEDMIGGGPAFIIEKRDMRPDGTAIWVRNSVVGIRDNEGRVTAGLTIAQDITDSREAEDAMRASEEQLRLVTDHAPVLLAQFDREHRYKFVNRPYAQRYGYEPQAVIGKQIADIVGRVAYDAVLSKLELAFTGQRVEFEMEIPYEFIGKRWGNVIFVPEYGAGNEVVGIVFVLTDITKRKEVELELEQARDRALAAVRAKDDFLARLSHELRTPLSPVLLLSSEGANNPELTDHVRSDFEIIRKNVDLEARLIDDLLDLTRITRGKLALDLKAVDVHAILADAVATMKAEAALKSIQLDLHLDSPQHRVQADSVRLQQVFWNLLNNSVKFTNPGGRIRVHTELHGDGSVVIEVNDTGIGMTKEELARIFDAFSQGDHAGTSGSMRFGGLGLGLAISRMLVEMHRGKIRASSTGRGQGATFTIELPLLAEGQPAVSFNVSDSTPTGLLVGPPPSARTVRKLRILLVEDHEPTRLALASLLGRRKHEVKTAGTLEAGRKLASTEEFDLLISDIGLPDGDGYDLMSELREKKGLKGIALSGYGMEHDIARSRDAGFVTHLTKPVRMEALDAAITSATGMETSQG